MEFKLIELVPEIIEYKTGDMGDIRWSQALFNAEGRESLGNDEYCCRLVYNFMKLLEKYILKAYDGWGIDIVFGEIEIA